MAWVSRAVLTFKFINGGGQLSPSGFHLGTIMKLQRREFLRLASAATTMPAVSRSADATTNPLVLVGKNAITAKNFAGAGTVDESQA
jgi:hypothetical protein